MKKFMASMMTSEVKGGQALTEYIAIVALLIIASAFALFNFREELIQLWNFAEDTLVALATEQDPPNYVEAVDVVREA